MSSIQHVSSHSSTEALERSSSEKQIKYPICPPVIITNLTINISESWKMCHVGPYDFHDHKINQDFQPKVHVKNKVNTAAQTLIVKILLKNLNRKNEFGKK